MQFIKIRALLKRIKAIKFLMKDKSVAWWKKGLIVFGILYLVLPIDLIPPFIPVLGFLDDLFLWIFILWFLSKELDKYWYGDSKDLSKKYGGKKVVDDVEYEVDDFDEK